MYLGNHKIGHSVLVDGHTLVNRAYISFPIATISTSTLIYPQEQLFAMAFRSADGEVVADGGAQSR